MKSSHKINIRFDFFSNASTFNKFCDVGAFPFGCFTETGSPLVTKVEKDENDLKYVQYGIFSERPTACEQWYPSLFTDVSKYMSWILDNITSE